MEKNGFRGGVVKLLLGIEVLTLFLGIKSFGNKNITLDDIKLLDNKTNNLFAIMVKDASGNYNESSTFPTGAYALNETMSSCVDNNGNKIENVLSYSDGVVSARTNKTVYCYLYFDKELVKVYDKIIEDYNNSNGVSKTTDENGKDVYYYTGNITNNNLVLNNYCWKMVRTTETDGVKLIYNGVYSEETKCNNTGTSVYIDSNKTAFNTSTDSPAYVGYMYGTVYALSAKFASDFGEYYYGNDVTWNGTTYTLSDAESGTIADMLLYSELNNKHYTCLSTSSSCSTVYYIYNMIDESDFAYYMTLTNGKKIEDALDEMLNYNTTNSNIKTVIDNWYSTNMTNVTDYLENAIYCNNRHITDLGGWNPSGGSVTVNLQFNDSSNARLTCQDKEDQFTLKADSGGTLGYGNNELDYPVGLLTSKEAELAFGGSKTNYLNNNGEYWLLSPDGFYDVYAAVHYVHYGSVGGDNVLDSFGARPAVSLSTKVKLSGEGNGTVESPYVVSK